MPQAVRPTQSDLNHYHNQARESAQKFEKWIQSAQGLERRHPNDSDVKFWKDGLKQLMEDMKAVYATIVQLKDILGLLNAKGI